ncbi:hypothetical protein [Polaribacter atrinae]|uniref:hypothetical protein n=1 Tax=Polaribacter atrinae TaxID=1333662 RepID=UPI0030F8C089
MATHKETQSAINVLKARLEQIKTSHHYKEEEKTPLMSKIQERLDVLIQEQAAAEPQNI